MTCLYTIYLSNKYIEGSLINQLEWNGTYRSLINLSSKGTSRINWYNPNLSTLNTRDIHMGDKFNYFNSLKVEMKKNKIKNQRLVRDSF